MKKKPKKDPRTSAKKLSDSAKRKYERWMVNSFDKKGHMRPKISFKNHVRLYRMIYSDGEREAVLGKSTPLPKPQQQQKQKKRSGLLSWFGL